MATLFTHWYRWLTNPFYRLYWRRLKRIENLLDSMSAEIIVPSPFQMSREEAGVLVKRSWESGMRATVEADRRRDEVFRA